MKHVGSVESTTSSHIAALRDVTDDYAKSLSMYSYPSEMLTVDEMTVPYRGYKCGFVVHNKEQPIWDKALGSRRC